MSQSDLQELRKLLDKAQVIVCHQSNMLDRTSNHIEELATVILKANALLQLGNGVDARKLLSESVERFGLNDLEVA